MAGTFSKIYYHIVFSTKDRAQYLKNDSKKDVYDYICGIIKDEGGFVYAIGGTADHIHLLCTLSTKKSLSEMLQRIKGHSSKWINLKFTGKERFKWQSGYGVFTVSHSQIDLVKQYILNQQTHHKKMTFEDEFKILLVKHNVEYNDEYIWK